MVHGQMNFRFVADGSFFHDAFRSDYSGGNGAKWLWSYIVERRGHDHNIIIATSDRMLHEILNKFQSPRSQLPFVLRNHIDIIPVPDQVRLPWTPFIVCMFILHRFDQFPFIVSSVKQKKWLERFKHACAEWEILESSKEMSDTRAMEQSWFEPIPYSLVARSLRNRDPFYSIIVRKIGRPSDQELDS